MKSFLCSAILVLSAALVSPAEVRAQSMQPNMKQMPGMEDAKRGTTVSATGTVAAVNTANRRKRTLVECVGMSALCQKRTSVDGVSASYCQLP